MRLLYNGLQAGNRSGTGRYTVELLRALGALDEDVEITAVWPKGMARPTGPPRVEYLERPTGGLRRVVFDQNGARRLAAELRADVTHYPASVGPLGRFPGLVLTIHDLAFLRHPEYFAVNRARYYRFAVGRSTRNAARIVADSQATADDIRELLGVPGNRIDVAHLGVGDQFRPQAELAPAVKARYQLPDRFFLYMGTLEPRKNLVRLVEAYSRVAGEVGQDLVLAGRWGWRGEALRHALASSPCHARIHLPDFIAEEDQPAILGAADAFLWPSLYEGFGLPPLEAMACGTPVLTANTSSLPEVVGDAAVTVDPTDLEALVEAIRRLAGDSTLRDRLRVAGPRHASAFTWHRCAKAVMESYRKAGR